MKSTSGLSSFLMEFITIVFFLSVIACSTLAQSSSSDDNLINRLQAMQVYKSKIDEQLEQVRINKKNVLALRDAQSVIDTIAEKFNLTRKDFDDLKIASDRELLQLAHQEQTLILRSSVLASSIQVLAERSNFNVDILDESVGNGGNYIPKCVCIDMKSGQLCQDSASSVVGYQIVETTLGSGMIIKNLSSSYNYIPATCFEYLTNFYNGKTGNGFYLVKPVSTLDEFPVYCDMANGGWMYVNGLLTMDKPDKLPINPITPDLTGSVEFKSLFALAKQAKSNIGDECTLVDSSQVDDYHERVMQYMCTINGFSLTTTPAKYISFFQYWIR